MPNLIVLTGSQRGRVVAIEGATAIGRTGGVDLVLADDLKVSSRHAQVIQGDEGLLLEDLGSTNGTFLNGSRVERPIALREGDILHIGSTELLVSDQVTLDENAETPAHPFQQFGSGPLPNVSFDVRLVADDTDEELILEPSRRGTGITLMLPVVQKVERSFSKATDLRSLVDGIGLSFCQAVGGSGVVVELIAVGTGPRSRSAQTTDAWRAGWETERVRPRVELCAWVKDGCLIPIEPDEEGFEVRERLLQRALHGGGALLGRSEGGEMALCLGMPHAAGVAGAVYVHGVRDGITQEDLRPLLLLASLAGVHCRTHMLLTELRERNEALETAQERLSRWNEELQAAAEVKAAELARSEASYRSLFHDSRDGNFTTDRRGRIEAINRTAGEILGLGLEEAVGRPLWLVFGPAAVSQMLGLDPQQAGNVTQRFGLNLNRLATLESPDVLEIPIKTPCGRSRMVEVLVRPIVTKPDTVEGMHVVLRDVSARHEAEERTRLLTRVVANVREAVVSATLDGVVTSWNPGAERLYQYRPEEVIGGLLPTVPDDRGAELESILTAVADGNSLAVRTERVSRDDRVVPVLATFAPVADAEGRIVGVVELARDLTDQLELEQRMRWQERMASFGELAAGLAHELGNPLANLRSGVEYLLDTPRDDPELNETLDLLHTEIERLHRLVKQALDLARWQRPTLAPVDGKELLAYVAAVVRDRAAELGVELVNRSEDGPAVLLLGEADQLKQALLNLVSNAFAAMPRGGRLELELEPAQGDPPLAAIRVRDTGCGIPAAVQERMFDLFFSGRSDGSGIGLAVVKRIVDLHQGRTRVESEEGEGTLIEVGLPLAPGLAPEPSLGS